MPGNQRRNLSHHPGGTRNAAPGQLRPGGRHLIAGLAAN